MQIEATRAHTAEHERSTLSQTLAAMRQDRGGADTQGFGQPFILKGVGEQDFGEWTHKVRTFVLARFGDQIPVLQLRQHVNERLLSRLAGLRRKTALYPGSMSLEKVPTRRTRSTASMIPMESSTHTLSLLQPTRPAGSSGMQVKAMAWKPGDDCTASATPRRPCDAWRSFSKFRTHRVASKLKI